MKYIIIFIWALIAPNIFHPFSRKIYCYLKQKYNDGYRCYYWDCKEYLTCKYNKKCLNCTPSKVHRCDWFAVFSIVFEFVIYFFVTMILFSLLLY